MVEFLAFLFSSLKETQTFKAYCFIIAVRNTKILKTYSLLKKILLSLSVLLSVSCNLCFLGLSQRHIFFQFLYTVLWEISNVTSDHLCCCIKNCVYNNFSLHYFVSSIMESLSQPSKLATANGNCRSQFKIYFQMLFYSF